MVPRRNFPRVDNQKNTKKRERERETRNEKNKSITFLFFKVTRSIITKLKIARRIDTFQDRQTQNHHWYSKINNFEVVVVVVVKLIEN